jgi:hypothetical protein
MPPLSSKLPSLVEGFQAIRGTTTTDGSKIGGIINENGKMITQSTTTAS